MIQLSKISKQFAPKKGCTHQALDSVDLHVERGAIHGVIGQSGAGKSTLIRCVNILERPDSGEVWVDGCHLQALSAVELRQARQKMGMIFQHFNLLSSETALGNVLFPLRFSSLSKEAQQKRALLLLDRVGLAEKQNAYPALLSGGQKQRVAIARALACEPSILLCDEMTSALDPESTQSILQLLKEIQSELSLTVLLITHEMEVIKRITDSVTVMEQGKVVESGATATVFGNPQHSATKDMLASTEHLTLPASIAESLQSDVVENGATVCVLSFSGAAAAGPVISESVQRFGVGVNILQASLSHIGDQLVGKMMLVCQGKADTVKAALAYYKEQGVNVEVLGYVNADDWAVI